MIVHLPGDRLHGDDIHRPAPATARHDEQWRAATLMPAAPPLAVAVPVRDEVQRLPALLTALAAQRGAPRFMLSLYFDGDRDGGRDLARAMAPGLPYPIEIVAGPDGAPPNAGLARGRACAAALARSPEAALFTTDADSVPDRDWLAAGLGGLRSAEVVAGRIALAAPGPLRRLHHYLDRLHAFRRTLDPVGWEEAPGHHWTSAASLSFRPGVYRALGGFAPLSSGEDADLCDRAWRQGLRVRRDPRVVVRTSNRRHGRAQGGFADLLATLDRADAAPMVEHPADEAWRYRRHALARAGFDAGDCGALLRSAPIDPDDLARVRAEVANADAFAARIVGAPPGGMRSVPLDVAEAALDRLTEGAMVAAL